MASLTEARADAFYFLAREIGERLIPPVRLSLDQNTTQETVEGLKDFRDLAQGHYSLFVLSTSPQEKADALVELAQQLINLGRFRQARQLLDQKSDKVLNDLPVEKQLLGRARVEQKYGWIADYEGGYFDSIQRFLTSRSLLERIPRERWGRDEQVYYSATTHFLGRGHYGLASQGINTEGNVMAAMVYFNQDLRWLLSEKEHGRPAPANEAFQHAWLSRCYSIIEDLDQAGLEIEEAGRLFQEFVESNPESGALAHYHVLKGRLRLATGLTDKARDEFNEALRIREQVEHYPKGYADAATGLALSYWQERKLLPAALYAIKAVRAFPFILAKGAFGG